MKKLLTKKLESIKKETILESPSKKKRKKKKIVKMTKKVVEEPLAIKLRRGLMAALSRKMETTNQEKLL